MRRSRTIFSSPMRRSRTMRRRSPVFSYKKKSKKLTTRQSLVDINVESLVDIKTLLNLSADKKKKLLESLVFFSGIESNFVNSIVNNLKKSKSEKDFIQKCENIEMSDLTKLNLVLYIYQVTLLLKKSKNSSRFGMLTTTDENGMELTQSFINNSFICPLCLDDFISTEDNGSLKLKGNQQISIVCAGGHMCHTECIKQYISIDYEATCPMCRKPLELKTLYLFEKDTIRLLQHEFKDMTDNTSRYLDLAESVKKSFLRLEPRIRMDQLTYIEQSREAILTVRRNFTDVIQTRIRRIKARISRAREIGRRAVDIMVDVVVYTCMLFVLIFICAIIDYFTPGLLEAMF